MPTHPLLTNDDIAVYLGTCKRTVDTLVQQGKFCPPIRVGRALRWRPSDVAEWEASQANILEQPVIITFAGDWAGYPAGTSASFTPREASCLVFAKYAFLQIRDDDSHVTSHQQMQPHLAELQREFDACNGKLLLSVQGHRFWACVADPFSSDDQTGGGGGDDPPDAPEPAADGGCSDIDDLTPDNFDDWLRENDNRFREWFEKQEELCRADPLLNKVQAD